ncbi:hypothetical protein CDAR_425741, partial [Caerostris darwini]
ADTFPALWKKDKQKRNQKNQHLTCEIEGTAPSMSVIGRESKGAEIKRIASLNLNRTRYPRREGKKQKARVMKEIDSCPNSFAIM